MKLAYIFAKCLDISRSKRPDYTTSVDPHENFKRSAEIASWFPMEDKSFAVLIGTKLARLGSLLSTNRPPNYESIEDSFLDLVNYCALWAEFRTSSKESPYENHESHMELHRQLGQLEHVSARSMRIPLDYPNLKSDPLVGNTLEKTVSEKLQNEIDGNSVLLTIEEKRRVVAEIRACLSRRS